MSGPGDIVAHVDGDESVGAGMEFDMIARLVGRETAERGLRYAEQHRVSDVKWDDERLVLRALVKGTESKPYRAMAKFNARPADSLDYNFGHCSCPVTINCKHVAAMLFDTSDYYAVHYRNMPSDLHSAAPDGQTDPAPREALLPEPPRAQPPAERQRKPKAETVSWRHALDSLLKPDTRSTVPLALQFELVARRQSALRPIRDAGSEPAYRLGVRPARLGDAGRWVVGGVSWRELNYYGGSANYRPEHFRWFTEFYALFKSQTNVYYPNEQRLFLDDFTNPKLWTLLTEAAAVGVELISTKAGGRVTLHDPGATPTFDIRRAAELTVSPVINLRGEPVPPDRLGFIGKPAHGIYSWESANAAAIDVAQLSTTIPPDVMSLIVAEAKLTVPKDDESDFTTRYYPLLSRRLDVVSGDDSFEAPDAALPVLLLEANYADSRTLELNWSWIYSGGAKKTLRPRPGEFRIVEFEQSVLDSLPIPAEKLVPEQTLTGTHAIDFSSDILDQLQRLEQVRVEITGERPDYQPAENAPIVRVERKADAEEGDWLDLSVTVSIDGEIIAFAALFAALAAGRGNFILPSGKYFPLNVPELARLRELIDEAATLEDQPPDGMRISKFQVGLWEEFEKLGIIEAQSSAWRTALKQLAGMDEMPSPALPDGLRASLRPYQADGFRWLAMLWQYRLGGILADDMGLGKTVQALALILHAKSTGAPGPFLVVAPTSVVPGWAAETDKFTPGLKAVAISETSRKRGSTLKEAARGADIIVTSYTLFRLDIDEYRAEDWAGLILDEAQAAKNHQARLYQCARRIDTPFKIAITGTPMENNLMELWSIFSIVAPGLFPANRRFAEYYRRPIEKSGNSERLAQLRRRIRPFIMRRRKQQVALDLPDKQEQIIELGLDSQHRRIYQMHLQRERKKVLGLIADMDKNRVAIFRSLTLLRQLSLAPVLIDDDHAGVPSAKIDALTEQLLDLVAEGHRALVFSQFTGFLGLIRQRLTAEGVDYSYLSGSTRNRAAVIDGFKNGDKNVFLISLKAGGVGLNLTEADYCFIMDPWWNPATEAQAVDRTHRIGQTKNVMVYRLVASDTIEEKVMELKERKAKLFAGVLDDGEFLSSKLSADDVRGLFT